MICRGPRFQVAASVVVRSWRRARVSTSRELPSVPGVHAGVRYPAPNHGSRGGVVPGMSRRMDYSQSLMVSRAGAGSSDRIAGARA